MRAVQLLLAVRSHSSADDSDSTFLWFRVNDDDDPTIDGADRHESIFELGMLFIEDLELARSGGVQDQALTFNIKIATYLRAEAGKSALQEPAK